MSDPGAGAIVMGTGIVSIALSLDHLEALSRIWLAAATAGWIALISVAALRLVHDRAQLRSDARSPASLTIVAATAVIGARLDTLGLHILALVLLAAAATIWACLGAALLRHGQLPRTGASFMVTVSLESLAALGGLQSGTSATAWLTCVALGLAVLGLAIYPTVLIRFDPRELLVGSGDHWIAGGALAISALAIGAISLACARQPPLRPLASSLADVGAAVWIASIVWLAPLLRAELRAPRLHYNLRRWSTLFPVGMYAASGFEVARASGFRLAHSFATGWTVVSVILWLVIAVGTIRHGAHLPRRRPVARGG